MKVKVVKRDGWKVTTPIIEISDNCPICGGPRGVPTINHFCEEGDWLDCNIWTNPCGHVDLYKNVLVEAGLVEDTL